MTTETRQERSARFAKMAQKALEQTKQQTQRVTVDWVGKVTSPSELMALANA